MSVIGGGSLCPGREHLAAIRSALEAAGVIFVEEDGDGPGVKLHIIKSRLQTKMAQSRLS